jgi:hypothetical protein
MRKFWFRSLFATLGMSGLMIGLQETNLAANLSTFTESEHYLEMLSSDSLDGVESRNHSEDFSEIFTEAKPKSEWEPIALNRPVEVSIVQIPTEILDLIQKVEVATGGSSLDSDQLFKMRYRMGFWLQ